MAKEINTKTAPTYLGTWSLAIPASDGPLANLYGAFNGCGTLLSYYATRSAAIRASSDLQDFVAEARMRVVNQRLSDPANEVLTKANSEYQPVVDAGNAEIEAMSNSLGNRKQASDPVSIMRADQIVRFYESQTAENQLKIVRFAMDSGDLETLSAILGAPKVLNLVSDVTRAAVETAMAQSADPAKFQALADLKSAVGTVSGALMRLRSFVSGDAGRASS